MGLVVYARTFALARACNVQYANTLVSDPLPSNRRVGGLIQVDDKMRPAQPSCNLNRKCCAFRWNSATQDQSPIGVPHVPFGPLCIDLGRRLLERILRWNWTILRFTTLRAPSPQEQPVGHGNI